MARRDVAHASACWRGLQAALPLAVPLAIYLLFPTRNFYWDGLAFAIDIEKNPPPVQLLQPNHLLYTPFGAGIYQTCLALGIETRALFAMQTANCILAAACVVLLYLILRRKGVAVWTSTAGALLFAFSATWWKFATDADAYIPSIFLLLVTYLAIQRGWPPWVAGIVHAGAMLMHQLAIFFLPVALWNIRGKGRRVYLATSLVPVGVIYVVAYRLVFGDFTLPGFLAWITNHSPDSGFSFDLLQSVFYTARGTLRLLFGGRIGDRIPDAATGALITTFVLVAAGLAWSLRRVQFRRVPSDLLVWIGVYAIFLLFWMPQNTFYRLFYLPPLIVAAVLSLQSSAPLIAACAFLWNFTFFIRPQSHPDKNPAIQFAVAQGERWQPGTPILFHQFHPDLWTISYFSRQAAWVGFDKFDAGILDHWLAWARERNQPMWLEATAYEFLASDLRGRAWLDSRTQGDPLIFRDGQREFRFHPVR